MKRAILKTQNEYTIQTFFEKIKDVDFTAGAPSMTKYFKMDMIVFPAIDGENQVQIYFAGPKRFDIMLGSCHDVESFAKSSIMYRLFGVFSRIYVHFNANRKKGIQQVDETAEKLKSLNL